MLYVGIDVGLKENKARFVDKEGNDCWNRLAFPNDADGAVALVRETCRALTRHGFQTVAFGVEATSFYAWHLALYLTGAPELAPFQPRVYILNMLNQEPAQEQLDRRLGGRQPGPDRPTAQAFCASLPSFAAADPAPLPPGAAVDPTSFRISS